MKKIVYLIVVLFLVTGCSDLSQQSEDIPRGTADPDFEVTIYNSDLAYNGLTILPDNHISDSPRVIEINMLGEITWEYVLPDDLKAYTNPGFDVELLEDNSILLVLPRYGIVEIDREGTIVWTHLDEKISHDVDRLENGNTLYVFGSNDEKSDPQVKEINPEGEIVWEWYAENHFNSDEYSNIYNEGWTHTNAVVRLENNNTLISPRNFNLLVEVDQKGNIVNIIGEDYLIEAHDPSIIENGNILVATHTTPQAAVEINIETDEVIWEFEMPRDTHPTRDANQLPNGNILITGSTMIVEVTPDKEIVWQFIIKDGISPPTPASAAGFYKAERIEA